MSRHLTHRFWICLFVGWGGAAMTLISRSVEPLALTSPFLAALALSLVDGWWPEVTVDRATVSSPRVVEGDDLRFTLDVSSDRPTWTEVEIQLPASLLALSPLRFVSMAGERRTLTADLRAIRWGATGPEWVVVTTRDRLGVSERVTRIPLELPVRVHPPSERLKSLIPLYRERPVTGEHRARAKGPGSELAEVRPYRFGDPVRMVHPRLTARRGTPMVVERHPDRSSDVVLLVDSAQDLGINLDTTLRWTVTAAMALGERHLRAQDRVGLIDLGHGVRWLPARLGRRHLHTVVDTLLATEVIARRPGGNVRVPPSGLPTSATIVAISPLLSETILSALVDLRSRHHEILVIKPSLPEPEGEIGMLARRVFRVGNELNERWLRDRGVVVIPWSTGDPLEHVMRRVVGNLGRQRQTAS
ncbi:MAG: DUF58 domain-containing protein [Actinomycetota bacterium]